MKYILKTIRDVFSDKHERNAFFTYMLVYFGIWITAMTLLRLTPLANGKTIPTAAMYTIAAVTGLIVFITPDIIRDIRKRKDEKRNEK